MGAESAALAQHCVYQCGFAVVNVGDDGNIADGLVQASSLLSVSENLTVRSTLSICLRSPRSASLAAVLAETVDLEGVASGIEVIFAADLFLQLAYLRREELD